MILEKKDPQFALGLLSAELGNGEATTCVVTHNLGRRFFVAQLYETESGKCCWPSGDITMFEDRIEVEFISPPAEGQYTLIAIG